MCGIAGIVGSSDPNNYHITKKMIDTISHRGPDGYGIWNKDKAFLGHRRLSIIDIDTGKQPMTSIIDGREHVIVFNGEIYNYKSIREKLYNNGVRFSTSSDTEVLLRLMIGGDVRAALNDLVGMFAFAYWNSKEERLILARDRMGIKPLYYHFDNGILTFGSSLESIICNPNVERSVDIESLGYFFSKGYPQAPSTLYSGVKELPPGSYLVWEDGKISITKYWKINWHDQFKGTEDEATECLDSLLSEVIKDHLVSDVPVGSFLSGGIDSSAVVARASRFAGPEFETFTVSFPDQAYDESKYARSVADHLGERNTVFPMESMPFNEETCRFVLKHVGQPFADSSCLPTYLVSKSASEKVRVVLSGDGGDELFAGYEFFDWGAKVNSINSLPKWLRKFGLLMLSTDMMPKAAKNTVRQLRKALKYSFLTQENLIYNLTAIIDPENIGDIVDYYKIKKFDSSQLDDFLYAGKDLKFNNALSRYLTEIDLPGDMLRKVDSMSMAASIEVRVPLLDHRIVEFAQRLPMSMKIKGNVRKYLLKKVVKSELPSDIFNHKKWGFSIPLHKTFDKQFFEFCRDVLMSQGGQVKKLIGENNMNNILNWNEVTLNPISHVWSNYTLNHVLWMMIQLELWSKDKGISLPEASYIPKEGKSNV